ncbi:MAG: ATP-dependent Lon protease [Abditibacteriota bacterium]|nr:ATP-dependent Lon protease [Abditibacteriota bacterium]
MAENEIPPLPEVLPVMATTNLVLFPFMMAPLTVGRPASLRALDAALQGDRLIVVTLQREENIEQPTPEELHDIGCACAIVRMMRQPDGSAQVIVQGIARVRLSEWNTDAAQVLRARAEAFADPDERPMAIQALMNNLLSTFRRIVELSPILPDEALQAAQSQTEPGRLADFVASTLNVEPNVRQELLAETDVQKRLERVTQLASDEVNVLELTSQIHSETRRELDKGQREFILRQQLREIQKQLGEGDDTQREAEELREQVEAANMPEEVRKAADRELNRLSRMPQGAAEYSVVRNYLDYLIAVPWSKSSEDNLDIAHARKVLDDEHYGLEDVKQRILEYLAVRRLKPDSKGPILCFVGPPGVGKTSLAHSIAHALGREFVRMALGGVRDEAEIRGHRRTYIGALPGRIVQGLRDAGTNNPVMILDEVDKLGSDYRGDPTSALLEVLDPQQNNSFKDHYLEVPVDLSKVMFITTANVLDTIPGPLRDRMEVLRIPGYTIEEKTFIARRHLLPRQMAENGLEVEDLTISDAALKTIAMSYTREAGVRSLEREVGSVCRKIARLIAEALGQDGERPRFAIDEKDLEEYLGPLKFVPEMGGREAQVGVTTGLAWTPMGGEILFIETTSLPNKGGLVLTGQLGEVMKESAQIAFDFLRANAKDFGIQTGVKSGEGIHVHVPAGAIPKDGPSAGVAITAALASLLSGRPARHDIAMTGEVTLTGRVLPVGGIKEKVLAARQAGITTLLLPERNRTDLRDIPEATRAELTFHFVEDVRDAVEKVLLPAPRSRSSAAKATPKGGASKNGASKNGRSKSTTLKITTPMEQNPEATDPAMAS